MRTLYPNQQQFRDFSMMTMRLVTAYSLFIAPLQLHSILAIEVNASSLLSFVV
jgi:hypothetical protein